jgi:RHS repeat-associated protein
VARRDQEGRTTRLEYDALDRVIRTLLPDGAEETAQYDDTARTRTTVDAEGRVMVTRLDGEARVVEVTNAAGGTKLFEYDAEGAKTRESSWFDGATPRIDTRFLYDEAGRLVRREEPLGRITTYRYDANSNVVEEVLLDELNSGFEPRVTHHEYDELNRVVATSRLLKAGGSGGVATMRYAYDGEGNKVEEIDALGRVRRTRYDELQRPIEQIGPEWRPGEELVTQRLYDGTGNLVEERRGNERLLADGSWESADQVRRFRYDALGRVVERIDAEGHASTFVYDRVGNLRVEVDARLERTEHRYDVRDRRIETLQHLNRRTVPARTVRREWVYDRVGNVVEERQANGNVVEHEHDALDRVVRSYDSLGTLMEAEYDARGNRVREVDARSHATVNVYDPLDRVVEVRRPEDRTERYGYDAAGNRVSMEDPLGRVTRYEHDRLDRLVATRLPAVGTGLGGTGPEAEAVENSTYDLAGNRLSATDARGFVTTFEYDALDRLVRQVAPAPLLHQSTFRYDAQGNLVETVDPRGIVELSRWDHENRRTQLQRDGIVVETASYDPSGNRELVTDANGVATSYVWDERDLLLEEARPLAAVTRYVRDDAGDVSEEIDPEGRATHREYDLRRRLVAEENGAGDRTEHGYDGSGNRTSMRRPEGGEWRYVYDEADRLVGVEDPLGHTSYDYDAADNLVEIVDAEGSSTRYEHDAHDRRVAVVRADGSREESAYDASGNRIARVDPKGQLTEWEYDALGREVSRSYAAPEEPSGDDLERTESAYDPNGNVVQVDEVYGGATSTRTTRFGYDTFDRVERVETPEGTLLYGYDAKGNRTRLRDADGRETLYAYDALDRVVTVTGPTGSVRSSYFRDSRLREVRHLGGAAGDTTATNEYDAAGRISAIWNRQGAALVSSYRYQYDHNGNRLVQEEQNGGDVEVTSYLYDAADRLVEVAYPERLVAYGYDGVANRVTERVAGVPGGEVLSDKAYRYDSRHRLLEISDAISGEATTFAWDANGNQRSRITTGDGGDEQLEYLYDSRDRLTEIRRGGLLLTTHRYDFRGLRFRKSGPDGVERFLWDGDRLLQERDNALNTAARYEWGSGRLLAMEHAEEGRRSYLFDGLGSVVDLVQPDGTLAARYQWDAWGEERRTIGESANRFGFTGHQREAESGLYYAKARFYDAGTGRFLREDPVEGDVAEPITLHDYVYARGNPTVWVDPTGLAGEPTQHTWNSEAEIPGGTSYTYDPLRQRFVDLDPAAWRDDPVALGVFRHYAEDQGARFKKPTIRERLAAILTGQWDKYYQAAREHRDAAVERFERATAGGTPVASPEDELANYRAGREKVAELALVFEDAGAAGVAIAEGTLRAADDATVLYVAGALGRLGTKAALRVGRAGGVADATAERIVPRGGDVARQIGTRRLPQANNPWIRYQEHATGRPYEELWQLGSKRLGVDARRAGYTVEVKWTGRNDAAWKTSPYNPNSPFYNEAGILDQARGLIALDRAADGKGVRYAVSNSASRTHFETLFRREFPGEAIQVWHVPGTRMR